MNSLASELMNKVLMEEIYGLWEISLAKGLGFPLISCHRNEIALLFLCGTLIHTLF